MSALKIRKKKSEKLLKKINVPINKDLPFIQDEKTVSLKTKEEIVDRLLALSIVAAKAMEAPPEKVKEFINRYNAHEFFTDEEKMFLSTPLLQDHDKIQYSWKLECIWVLLWSVNLIPELGLPSDPCNAEFIFETVFLFSKQELLDNSSIIPVREVLDHLDFIYRAHWSVREAQLN